MSSSRPQQWLPTGIGEVVGHPDRRLVRVRAAFGRITANFGCDDRQRRPRAPEPPRRCRAGFVPAVNDLKEDLMRTRHYRLPPPPGPAWLAANLARGQARPNDGARQAPVRKGART
jgi:hypothetical protein